jgi:cellobiose phosphorylase
MIPNIRFESRSRSAAILFNTFLPYQVAACRFFARASFYQSGGAYGFRDQLQDCLCLVYSNPKLVSEHIVRACAHQYTEGDVQHWWHPILTNGVNRGVRSKCSDDFLWLPYVTADYIKKTADYSVLDTEVEYITSPMLGHDAERYELPSLSGIRESVYKHCLRAPFKRRAFRLARTVADGFLRLERRFFAGGRAGQGREHFYFVPVYTDDSGVSSDYEV